MSDERLTPKKQECLLPRPYPEPELFKSVLKTGFETYPQRKRNYEKYKNSKRGEILEYQPIKLDIENVSRCNFHCIMCQINDFPKRQRAEDMSFEDFKNLINSQYGIIEIKLQGVGEPLLGSDYFKMIVYARSKHIWVRSTTNASLLHINDNYKRVMDTDVCELQVSVDGATKETYEKIRKGGNFTKVTENIKMLNSYAAEIKHYRTRMWVGVQKSNYHEMERFPALAARLGFKRLSLCTDLNEWGQERWREKMDDIQTDKEIGLSLANKLIELGKENNVEVTFWNIYERFNSKTYDRLCPWPFERVFISSDMRIVPCCRISNPDIFDLGDARKLTEEWNSKKMREFRRMHISGNIPDICKYCYTTG